MPWCEECDTDVDTEDLGEGGTCPTCGNPTLEHRRQPWWFKFLAVATVIYLGYRAFQGVTWVIHHV